MGFDDDIVSVSRLIDHGPSDPPVVPLAVDRLGIFGAALYAVFQEQGACGWRVQVIVKHEEKWRFEGSGFGRAPSLLGERSVLANPDGPFLIPFASGSHSRDDVGKQWSVSYIAVRASPVVVRVTVTERDETREFVPLSHGNLVILFRDGRLPSLTASDHQGNQLLDGIDTQPGFARWVSERRGRDAW